MRFVRVVVLGSALVVGAACAPSRPLAKYAVYDPPPDLDADRDSDRDGILDRFDRCPMEPEDRDGFQDGDGCPEPDNDGDGILDRDDNCPNEPEDKDGFEDVDGCPDPDNDHDGILDLDEKCPNQPETFNGFQDDDGCPDNPSTANPNAPFPPGHPAWKMDGDGDGVVDALDDCPQTFGSKANHGCP